LENELLKVT